MNTLPSCPRPSPAEPGRTLQIKQTEDILSLADFSESGLAKFTNAKEEDATRQQLFFGEDMLESSSSSDSDAMPPLEMGQRKQRSSESSYGSDVSFDEEDTRMPVSKLPPVPGLHRTPSKSILKPSRSSHYDLVTVANLGLQRSESKISFTADPVTIFFPEVAGEDTDVDTDSNSGTMELMASSSSDDDDESIPDFIPFQATPRRQMELALQQTPPPLPSKAAPPKPTESTIRTIFEAKGSPDTEVKRVSIDHHVQEIPRPSGPSSAHDKKEPPKDKKEPQKAEGRPSKPPERVFNFKQRPEVARQRSRSSETKVRRKLARKKKPSSARMHSRTGSLGSAASKSSVKKRGKRRKPKSKKKTTYTNEIRRLQEAFAHEKEKRLIRLLQRFNGQVDRVIFFLRMQESRMKKFEDKMQVLAARGYGAKPRRNSRLLRLFSGNTERVIEYLSKESRKKSAQRRLKHRTYTGSLPAPISRRPRRSQTPAPPRRKNTSRTRGISESISSSNTLPSKQKLKVLMRRKQGDMSFPKEPPPTKRRPKKFKPKLTLTRKSQKPTKRHTHDKTTEGSRSVPRPSRGKEGEPNPDTSERKPLVRSLTASTNTTDLSTSSPSLTSVCQDSPMQEASFAARQSELVFTLASMGFPSSYSERAVASLGQAALLPNAMALVMYWMEENPP